MQRFVKDREEAKKKAVMGNENLHASIQNINDKIEDRLFLINLTSVEHIRSYLVGTAAEKQKAIAELVKIHEEAKSLTKEKVKTDGNKEG